MLLEEIIHSVNVPSLSGEQADIVKHQLTCLCGQHLFICSAL